MSSRRRDLKIGALIDPATTLRDQAVALLRAKHHLLGEEVRRRLVKKARRKATGSNRAKRERRLFQTGEQAFERPWLDPVSTHPTLAGTVQEELDNQSSGFSLAVSERQYRASQRRRGRTVRGAYWALLGATPTCLPGDLTTAAIFHRRIVQTMERGGWTHNEATALGLLERKWGKRARGEDPRFVLAGNRSGRLNRNIERRIKTLGTREG